MRGDVNSVVRVTVFDWKGVVAHHAKEFFTWDVLGGFVIFDENFRVWELEHKTHESEDFVDYLLVDFLETWSA